MTLKPSSIYGVSLPIDGLIIAVYNAYFSHTGLIYYRMTDKTSIIATATKDVNDYLNSITSTYSSFTAAFVIVVTWDMPSGNRTDVKRNLFQVVIATNGNKTFGIFNYEKLFTKYATAG